MCPASASSTAPLSPGSTCPPAAPPRPSSGGTTPAGNAPPRPPRSRDRALAAVMRFAGARIAEAVGLDLDDLPTTQRRRRLRIRGKGRRNRSVAVHPELGAALDAWLDTRRGWPDADTNPAVFLNRTGGRLSLRAADEIIGTIATAAGLADRVTPHVLRHIVSAL